MKQENIESIVNLIWIVIYGVGIVIPMIPLLYQQ